MKRHLFLTGPIGCGKSTAIRNALGPALADCGGFLTRRVREPELHFLLERPDGSDPAVFLDFPEGEPVLHLEVFRDKGTALLRGRVLVLDEIGGAELLCPEFCRELERVLSSDVPVLGVVKGEGPASALIRRLGLTESYETAAAALRQRLRDDENTFVYQCGMFDRTATGLAEEWVKEYCL